MMRGWDLHCPAKGRHRGIEAGSGYRSGFDFEFHLNGSLGDCR